MITGNKGDWSEIYTLFKLLSDGNLFAGDENLNKIKNLFYPIVKILRKEVDDNFSYEIHNDIVVIEGADKKLCIPVNEFTAQADKLLSEIKGAKGVFNAPEAENFMQRILCKTLKAKSSTKTDINIVIHDIAINQNAQLGFSIKSQIGGNSTLLNAGLTTNFIFKVEDFKGSEQDLNEINSIDTRSKIKDRIEAIKNLGGTLHYYTLENPIFKNNLILIDSSLPSILAHLLLQFYTTNSTTIAALTSTINNSNPLMYDTQFSHSFYEYKIKRFLTDVALGMMPSKVWSGLYDATGGYLIVKEDGDILCYHIYNRNHYENYLFNNTKLETASSTRHQFGKLYLDNTNNLFLKLNLQIRFI